MVDSAALNRFLLAKAGVRTANKYHATKVEVAGKRFDSKAEARYYLKLLGMEQNGLIRDLQLQKRYILQDAFVDNLGRKQRPITYVADFVYTRKDGQVEAVDVKSKITEANQLYRLKRKMFLCRYPEIRFVEVIT